MKNRKLPVSDKDFKDFNSLVLLKHPPIEKNSEKGVLEGKVKEFGIGDF